MKRKIDLPKCKLYVVGDPDIVDDGTFDHSEVFFTLEKAADAAEEEVKEREDTHVVYELVPVMAVEIGKPIRRMITE